MPISDLIPSGTAFDAISIRLVSIIHVDTMLHFGEFSDTIRAQFDADLAEMKDALLAAGWRFAGVEKAQSVHDLERLFDGLPPPIKIGFFVKAEQPYFSINTTGISSGWKYTRTKWFFARDYETTLIEAFAWGGRYNQEAWARAKSTPGYKTM